MLLKSMKNDEKQKANFTVYRSISGMLWRFAAISPSGRYIKGDDYVQSTLLDFRLQSFLQRIYHNLPNTNNESNLKAFTWQQYCDQADDPAAIEEPHELMGVKRIIKFKKIFKNTLGIRGNYGSCGSKITKEHIAFGASALETAYSIVPNSDNSIFDIQKNDEKYTMRGEVKSVNLQLKNPTDAPYNQITLFYLFVQSFEIKSGELSDTYSDCRIPTFIQSTKQPITKYGLVSQHFGIGAYICKVLEYSEQCDNTVKQTRCTKTYNFNGDLWKTQDGNHVFPFNKLS